MEKHMIPGPQEAPDAGRIGNIVPRPAPAPPPAPAAPQKTDSELVREQIRRVAK